MNEKTYNKIRELKKNIKFNSLSGNKENLFQYFPNNTDEHEDKKFEVFKELRRRGYSVYVEPELINNQGRPDLLFILPNGEGGIIEIVHTESEDSIKNKVNKYPIDFELIIIRTKDKEIEIPL